MSLIALSSVLYTAQAQPPVSQGSAVVRYSDLDLATTSGARTMLGRIEKAAIEACGRSPYLRAPHSPQIRFLMSDYRNCREESVARAVTTLHAPLVARLYAESRAIQPNRLAGR